MSLRVSVVVPTYRRPEFLRRALTALLTQDFPPGDYEVVICDDAAARAGDAAETQAVIEEVRRHALAAHWAGAAPALASLAESVPAGSDALHEPLDQPRREWVWLEAPELPEIRYVPIATPGERGPGGPAAARNAGWRAAGGEIIAFTDDDCLPVPGWLAAGVAALERDARLVGVMGQTLVPLPPAPTDYEVTVAGLQRSEFITANCFYRRAALEAVGGFDERFSMAWREDSDLFFTLLDRYGAGRLGREPTALVVHPVRPGRWGISLSQQERTRFNALLYKKHARHYRARLAPVRPWRYYGILAAFGAGCVALAAGSSLLAVLGWTAWAGLTGRFAAQRLIATSRAPGHVAEMLLTSVAIPFLSLYWRWRGALEHRVFFP